MEIWGVLGFEQLKFEKWMSMAREFDKQSIENSILDAFVQLLITM